MSAWFKTRLCFFIRFFYRYLTNRKKVFGMHLLLFIGRRKWEAVFESGFNTEWCQHTVNVAQLPLQTFSCWPEKNSQNSIFLLGSVFFFKICVNLFYYQDKNTFHSKYCPSIAKTISHLSGYSQVPFKKKTVLLTLWLNQPIFWLVWKEVNCPSFGSFWIKCEGDCDWSSEGAMLGAYSGLDRIFFSQELFNLIYEKSLENVARKTTILDFLQNFTFHCQ